VVIAVLILLLAMLVPSLSRAREQARRVYCMNNLSHWGRAIGLYREDNRDYLPAEGNTDPDQPHTWYNELPPYLDAPPYRDVEGAGRPFATFLSSIFGFAPQKTAAASTKASWEKTNSTMG
jgi:type II secretory pathway pseudopilin PulG